MFNEMMAALESLKTGSCGRLARECIRLEAQKSSINPILTKRRQDFDDRKAEILQFEIISRKIAEQSVRFPADKQWLGMIALIID
jgi:hypothetical protein